jgi:hypothetical protein
VSNSLCAASARYGMQLQQADRGEKTGASSGDMLISADAELPELPELPELSELRLH